ncbi:hypothetical protein QE197_24960 (plasmid) [Arsenophonus nasoniae]|uniref:Uncharacterized protein n=1 Tax=Arsenophonus nasoniae TaxID=638 RepID=A0A4P7KY63_9GAMM|nr:hypothetical protein [Arsenophonus nasoniae]QBY42514.1 hypothetical protein ArsFIN_10660 [Arsenophonus nasoniae]QBY44445.1 hypothetical protein ArsFIN_30310 [Arsenophonus nasoniae]WGM04701.1 hypothetical protein QE258_13965 [Arsenophonus nasoniae]WGM06623.1 hypothetical protein QE258_04690 [Arsenophonus nasoniae]WGM09055.1 hypothetical protein QE258_27470 [Arsenophonus nasoniae]
MMRLDNPRILTAKHPNMGNLVGVTNGSRDLSDSIYLSSIDIRDDDDREIRTFKEIIRCLTNENDRLEKENRRLMKIYREIGGLCRI